MKIGSIVVVLPMKEGHVRPEVKWLPVMDEKTPYMIRDIGFCFASMSRYAVFEEGVIGHNFLTGTELGVPLSQLREILPPGEVKLEEILEEVMVEQD
jgi:hypothetical protein